MENKTQEEQAWEKMKEAFELLKSVAPTRENSVALTQLETAMMWVNKDRVNKGQLEALPTHVRKDSE